MRSKKQVYDVPIILDFTPQTPENYLVHLQINIIIDVII